MFSASKSGSVLAKPDPQFNYVTALLHGDGTNGAQNNTFLDSSTNAFTITRNGTPTQGSFSPYGSLWGNYLNGTTDYLITNNTTNLGSGNFTIEGWFYISGTGVYLLLDTYNGGANSWQLYIQSNTLRWYSASGSSINGSTTLALNTWYHLAVVKNGTSLKSYVNGTLDGSATDTANYNGTSPLWIGAQRSGGPIDFMNGYISNVRIVVGTAVYTSTFTPPTSPLTAITGTQLLTCQSNRFIDNSGNAYVITPTGTPSVQRFNPFLPTSTQAYSTSVYGGSAYFAGASAVYDYITSPTSSNLAIGTNNFTLEGWFYNTSVLNQAIFCQNYSSGIDVRLSESGTTLGFYMGSATWNSASFTITNAWTHFAVVRNGSGTNNVTLYVNGQVFLQITNTTNLTANQFQCGKAVAGTANNGFNGYLSDCRFVNGTAVYTSAFTPPTSPLTAVTNTQLLLSYQNGAIYDNAMMNDWITVGSAQISTSVKKYGTGSLSFNGSTDQLTSNAPNTNLYAFGTNDFTIEMWFYVAGGATANTNLYDSTPSGGGVVALQIYIIGSPWTIRLYGGSAGALLDSNFTVSTSTWYHLAICRASGSTKIFVNGTQQGSTYSDSNNYTNGSQRPVIGAWGTGSGNYFNGYIDDLRVTKGYARYTSNFTPPTQALPNYGM